MIKSMTGYGKTVYQDENFNLDIEMKTINSRFLDINIRMPNQLNFLEDRIKKIVKNSIERGRVDIFIKSSNKRLGRSTIKVDIEAAKSMKDSLDFIANTVNLKGEKAVPSISDILLNEDVITYESDDLDEDLIFNIVSCELQKVIQKVIFMRNDEGKNLYDDLKNNLLELINYKSKINEFTIDIKSEIREKLYKNISDILDKNIINEDRLANEIVLYADRIDINEEITRLDSHFEQFQNTLESKEAVGKKLDFICQELLRETNTIGSKSSKIEILNIVIEMKTIIEKIKEQVQNVE